MTAQEVFAITINHGYILQIFAAEILYGFRLKRRNHFVLRAIFGVLLFAFLAVVLPNIVAHFVSGLFSLIIFLLSLGLLWFCFDTDITTILFIGVSAQFTQNLSYNVENSIYQGLKAYFNNVTWFLLSFFTTVITYIICYFVFARKIESGRKSIKVKKEFMFFFAFLTAIFIYVMHFLLMQYGLNGYWITHLPLAACSLFGLMCLYYFLDYSNQKRENESLEAFLSMQSKEYEIMKNNMELLNFKAHDLKQQVLRLEAVNQDEVLADIKETIDNYDTQVVTGNETLDVVLTEKKLRCLKEKIEFTIIADGKCLASMKANDIASVFGNAIDNAIEYEMKVTDEKKRYISLQLFQKKNIVCIHIENYCPETFEIQDGLPLTSKEDKQNHGFGLKSIRYIVEKYGGTLNLSVKNNLFNLDILLPKQV